MDNKFRSQMEKWDKELEDFVFENPQVDPTRRMHPFKHKRFYIINDKIVIPITPSK